MALEKRIPIFCNSFSDRRFMVSSFAMFCERSLMAKNSLPPPAFHFLALFFLFFFFCSFEFSNFELWSCQPIFLALLHTLPRSPHNFPFLTNFSLPINSCLIMVHTRRSPLSQPSTVATHSTNVSILFALVSKNEDHSYSYEVCRALMRILSCSRFLLIIFLITNDYASLLSFA